MIAARRSNCTTLVFPEGNRRDVDELPAYLKENLNIHYAKTYDDVYKVAFGEDELPTPKKEPPSKAENTDSLKDEERKLEDVDVGRGKKSSTAGAAMKSEEVAEGSTTGKTIS